MLKMCVQFLLKQIKQLLSIVSNKLILVKLFKGTQLLALSHRQGPVEDLCQCGLRTYLFQEQMSHFPLRHSPLIIV
jgi:hypothetical protein